MTATELRLIAAPAMIGLSSKPKKRVKHSRRVAIDGDEHRGLAVLLKFRSRGFQRLEAGDLFAAQEIRFANHSRDSRGGRSNRVGQPRFDSGAESSRLTLLCERALHWLMMTAVAGSRLILACFVTTYRLR